jgi:hypothetical protein
MGSDKARRGTVDMEFPRPQALRPVLNDHGNNAGIHPSRNQKAEWVLRSPEKSPSEARRGPLAETVVPAHGKERANRRYGTAPLIEEPFAQIMKCLTNWRHFYLGPN